MTSQSTPPFNPEGHLVHSHVSVLSDYGHADESVGVVHSVLKALAPGVEVIDITHGIAPFDVRGGGLALARSVQYMCPGVVMALVDPGVGTSRRAVAVEVGNGSSVLLGPDNGVLAPAVSMVGGATRAVVLDNSDHHLDAPGPSFAGRDVFAPSAALLCRGIDLGDLGTEIDPVGLLPGTLPLSRTEDDGLHAEVLWVDRFGNAQLNVDPEELDSMGDTISLSFHSRMQVAQRTEAFGALPAGALGVMVDSYGLMTLVANQVSAAEQAGLFTGDEVVLAPTGEDLAGAGAVRTEIPVELGLTRGDSSGDRNEPRPGQSTEAAASPEDQR